MRLVDVQVKLDGESVGFMLLRGEKPLDLLQRKADRLLLSEAVELEVRESWSEAELPDVANNDY